MQETIDKVTKENTELKQRISKLLKLLTMCGHCGGKCDKYGNCNDAFTDDDKITLHEQRLNHAGLQW
jgi:hypothetical protein